MAQEPEVTEEQAEGALREMLGQKDEDEPTPEVQKSEPEEQPAEEVPVAASPAETEESEQTVEPEPEGTVAVPETDDVASLKQRLGDLEKERTDAEERAQKRLDALKQRGQQNEDIFRQRYLRKSASVDKLTRLLEATKSEGGVSEADVNQAIAEAKSTMNPASASYEPPPESSMASEDQTITANRFLDDKGMSVDEADQFNTWIRTEARNVMAPDELNVARESLAGFLRLAHGHWRTSMQQSKEQKRNDAVEAVKSVKRVQKQAAKAAESRLTGPAKQPAAKEQEVDLDKLTEADVSALVRQATDQYIS